MADDYYEKLKNDGNEKFKKKDFNGALSLYSQALSINQTGVVAYANRALCHINLKNFFEAREDCDKAISLDPRFTKAYYRRATANRELFRYRDAIADLRRVAELDPDFQLAVKEMKELTDHLEKDTRLVIRNCTKPEHLLSSKPIKSFQMLNQYSGTKQYQKQTQGAEATS